MALVLSIVGALGAGAIFWWGVPLGRLFAAFQPLTVALSIMLAAVFVRLNRGFPSVEWKAMEPFQRKQLSKRLVDLAAEYGWIAAINAVAVVLLISLAVVGAEAVALWPDWFAQLMSAAVGGVLGLACVRMIYVVWRDYDIVRVQGRLIDAAADKEAEANRVKDLEDNLTKMREAGLRKVSSPPPREWDSHEPR